MAETERAAQQDEEAVTALRQQIATLRETIEHAEREGEARAAEVARLEREIAGLRDAVTRADRDAAQNAAAAKSLEAELAAMQSALVAARQVGRAAVDALAMDKSAPLDRPPRLGWRHAVRQWFGFAVGGA